MAEGHREAVPVEAAALAEVAPEAADSAEAEVDLVGADRPEVVFQVEGAVARRIRLRTAMSHH